MIVHFTAPPDLEGLLDLSVAPVIGDYVGALGKVWLVTSRLVTEREIMVWLAEAEAKK